MAYGHPPPTPARGQYSSSHSRPANRSGRADADSAVGYLALVTALMGVAVYSVSMVPPAHAGWAVRFSVLAAVVGALTALPSGAPRHWVVVTLAVTGFLDGTATLIETDRPGWAPIVIVVLGGLQTAAALAALALDRGRITPTAATAAPSDAIQAYYAAYQAYIAATRQATPRRHWDDSGQAAASAQALPTLEAMHSHYQGYIAFAEQRQHAADPAAAQTGLTDSGATAAAGPAAGVRHYAADHSGYRERHAADPNA